MKVFLGRTLLTGLFGAVVFLTSLPAVAQTATRISFEHDGQGVSGFALYAESGKGKPLRVDLGMVTADAEGKRVVAVPRLPDGSYALSVAAYNAAGESARVPAAPARVFVRTEPALASTPSVSTGQPPATQPTMPAPADTAPKKSGTLGRLWKVLVGED